MPDDSPFFDPAEDCARCSPRKTLKRHGYTTNEERA